MERFHVIHHYVYGIFPGLVIIDGGYNKETTILENDILLFSNVYHN